MPKPCSLDLRMRLLEAVIAGASRREAYAFFFVPLSFDRDEAGFVDRS